MIGEFCSSWDEDHENILLADGLEDAFIGIVVQFNKPCACYDYDKCVKVLMKRDGMSHEEATEFLDFNTLGAWVGEYTPMFLFRFKPAVG